MIAVLDLDGTLIDSGERHEVLMHKLLQGTGYEDLYDGAEYMQYKADGNSGKNYLVNVLNMPVSEAEMILNKWTAAIETEEMIQKDRLYEDAVPFLEKLKAHDFKIIYLTARQDKELLLAELRRLGIEKYANHTEVVNPSEAKDGKRIFLQDLKQSSHEVMIIGDTENEYRAGKECKISFFLLNRGFRSKTYWDRENIKSYSDLDEVYEQLREHFRISTKA